MSLPVTSSAEAPKVSVTLHLDGPNFRVGDGAEVPTLYITITSYAAEPITVFTWPTILYPKLALQRKNFYCLDLTEDRKPLILEIVNIMRLSYVHYKGSYDDEYHITLPPEEPVVLDTPFTPAMGANDGRPAMKPSHRYLFGVADGEKIDWWREGTREQVLRPREDYEESDEDDKHSPIRIENVQPVEFVVEK